MRQLDGLRGLAVLCIMWHHWAPESLRFGLPWGSAVQCFFVLSGFLITGILLKAKQDEILTMRSRKTVVVHFYCRRMLRLLPLYYIVLTLAVNLGINDLPKHVGWHVFYASNLCYLLTPGWGTPIGHFWTLAVEEQFYVLWPFFVLYLSDKAFIRSLFAIILAAVVWRFVGKMVFPVEHYFIFTLGSFDSLAIGGFLAFAIQRPTFGAIVARWRSFALTVSGAFFTADLLGLTPDGIWPLVFLFQSVIFAGLIELAAGPGFRGIPGAVLSSDGLCYIGKISYGLYLFHNFASIPTKLLLGWFPFLKLIPANILVLNFVLTMVAASVSWFCFERPILRLKRFVPM